MVSGTPVVRPHGQLQADASDDVRVPGFGLCVCICIWIWAVCIHTAIRSVYPFTLPLPL